METLNYQEEKYAKAQKKVEEFKKFYKHLVFFIVVNGFFIVRRIYKDIDRGDTVLEALSEISNYHLIFWWTIILVLHAFKIYGTSFLFSKDWEQKKIKKYMDQ